MSAEYVNNIGSLLAYFVLAVLAFMVVGTCLGVIKNRLVGSNKKEDTQPEVKKDSVDMTPPVLTQPSTSIDSSASLEAVTQVESVVKESVSPFVTEVQFAGSKVTRKGTANDAATWSCPKSFFGNGYAMAPQAVQSSDPQRLATALRLRKEAEQQAVALRKQETKRAKKYKTRLKAFRESIVDTATRAAEDELLEHHLREAGVI